MKVLVTGGAGFIGSHTAVELLNKGYDVTIVDDFSNSKPKVIDYIRQITGKNFNFYEGNVCDKKFITKVFKEEGIGAVIHFAGFKSVGESVSNPLKYYKNNINSTLTLLEVMEKLEIYNFVFSSSATVYGTPEKLPIKENSPLSATNPYGWTKLMNEQILKDLCTSTKKWNIVSLRYFNPIGAHESGLIGEEPNGIPNNIMPYIMKVATGEFERVHIFGNDYDTIDGTGIRDYIHVVDLAKGHIKALEYLSKKNGFSIFNLGTGKGSSVLELINMVSKVNNVKIPYVFDKRRDGDVAQCYADVSKAYKELDFKTTKNLEDMCRDSYNFVIKNNN